MELRRHTGHGAPALSILNTYAPTTGYNFGQPRDYWDDMGAFIGIIPQHLTKGYADHGEIAMAENKLNNAICKWDIDKSNVSGNGLQLHY